MLDISGMDFRSATINNFSMYNVKFNPINPPKFDAGYVIAGNALFGPNVVLKNITLFST